ncbi:MAG: hypothetical protein IKW83_11485 [Muribaculaceae bacterium]|nr:hypothetical protein [Muribaculaceae bacterium]
MPTKEQVLSIAHGVPVPNLISSIKRGIITLDELKMIKLAPEKLETIEQKLKAEEDQLWTKACTSGEVADFFNYLKVYPNGVFADACRQSLVSGEEYFWRNVLDSGSVPMLKQYLEYYEPLGGAHVYECQEMIEDPDWVQVKKQPTLINIEAYEQANPGKHKIEIAEMREKITDDIDWQKAQLAGDTPAFHNYLETHPQGKFVALAQERIEAAAGHDAFIADMQNDLKNADEIQNAVASNIITWNDVIKAYDTERAKAIQNFIERDIQPNPNIPDALTKNSTEVYFWGTPSSGKTCALGSILCGAMNNYFLEPQQCQGYHYMTQLRNVFDSNNKLCSLPPSTIVNVIQEMVFTITDPKKKLHRATFIDIAGEIFRAIYSNMNGMFLDQEHKETLSHVMKFLSDNSNPKIHFFVVEYGAESTQWEGLYMRDYLHACSLYIKDNKILKNSTGVYILVTKCDKMHCPDEQIVDNAEQYVQNNLISFYHNLHLACEDAGIKDFKVIPFSIGEVFAGKICRYDDSFIDDVIDVLIAKTPTIKKNNFLRM